MFDIYIIIVVALRLLLFGFALIHWIFTMIAVLFYFRPSVGFRAARSFDFSTLPVS
jgi:hypothetical protein